MAHGSLGHRFCGPLRDGVQWKVLRLSGKDLEGIPFSNPQASIPFHFLYSSVHPPIPPSSPALRTHPIPDTLCGFTHSFAPASVAYVLTLKLTVLGTQPYPHGDPIRLSQQASETLRVSHQAQSSSHGHQGFCQFLLLLFGWCE